MFLTLFRLVTCQLIVHTADNRLHFVSERVESVALPDGSPQYPLRSAIEPVLGVDSHPGLQPVKSLPQAYDKNHIRSKENIPVPDVNEHCVVLDRPHQVLPAVRGSEHSLIDRITVTEDGYILFKEYRIPISRLLSSPFNKEGILITASKIHTTQVIRNTLVVLAKIQVDIADMYVLAKRNISFSYIVYIHTAVMEYEIDGCELRIFGKKYVFPAPIAALYGSREQMGLNYMVRLFQSQEMSLYHREEQIAGLAPQVPKRPWRNVVFTGLVLAFIVILCSSAIFLIMHRKIVPGKRVHKQLRIGRFMDRECLVYDVDQNWIHQHSNSKIVTFCDLIFVGRIYTRYVACTEMTYQYSSCTKAHNMSEQLLQLVQAVALTHAAGTVHGRLCPENVRLSSRLELRLQDFFDNRGWRSPNQIRTMDTTQNDDYFSLGCIIHFLLTGWHPFDLRGPEKPPRKIAKKYTARKQYIYEDKDGRELDTEDLVDDMVIKEILTEEEACVIENNILRRVYLIRIADQVEHDLIYTAIFKDTTGLCKHPYFWTVQMRTELLCDFSDFIESVPSLKPRIERNAHIVFEGSWLEYLDPLIVSNISAKRRYDSSKLSDLLRFLRNTHRHSQELLYKSLFDPYEGCVGGYYMDAFPELFMIVYRNKDIRKNSHFLKYFD